MLQSACGRVLSVLTVVASATLCHAEPILYVSDEGAHSLYTFDPRTGSTKLVGDFGIPNTMNALAYDDQHNIMYGLGLGNITRMIYSIDRTTGRASFIGDTGLLFNQGLAYDHNTGFLYTTYTNRASDIDPLNTYLYQIDPRTEGDSARFAGNVSNSLRPCIRSRYG